MRRDLDGVRVFHTLYRRWVARLVERVRQMWRYGGPSDPDRASSEELPNDEVWSRLDRVLQMKPKKVDGKPAPFNSAIMSRLVYSLLFSPCFFLYFPYFLISSHPFRRRLEFTSPGHTFLRLWRAWPSRSPRRRRRMLGRR